MEVSLKNYEILNAKAALDKLSEQEAASIKTVYALSKISKEVAVHAKDLEEFKEKLEDLSEKLEDYKKILEDF